MIRSSLILLLGGAFALTAAAQSQSGAQASTQTDTKASVQAGKTQAGASANTSTNASAQAGPNGASLASGTAINATLNGSVDARKNKPGDTVTARTAEAVKSDGKVVLPKGTKLIGHVTQAKARAKGESESALGIVFDKAVLKNGEEVGLNVAIQAMAAAQSGVTAAGSDLDTMAGAGGSMAGSGSAAGRGALGGVASTAGGAVGGVTNTAANVGGAAGGAVNSTANVASHSAGAVGGLNASGTLMSNSRGVFGLNGLNLNTAASNSTQGSLITSTGKNVHLDSGTQFLLVSQAQAGAQSESKQPGSSKPAREKPEQQKPEPRSEPTKQ